MEGDRRDLGAVDLDRIVDPRREWVKWVGAGGGRDPDDLWRSARNGVAAFADCMAEMYVATSRAYCIGVGRTVRRDQVLHGSAKCFHSWGSLPISQ